MHFMTVCLASLLFPLLICPPSGRVRVGKSSRLPWPQSHLSGCGVCRPSQAASHTEMTGAVLSPPSAECAAAFSWLLSTLHVYGQCGFFHFFCLEATKRLPLHRQRNNTSNNLHIQELHELHPFGFLHFFLKLQSVSFATYQVGLDEIQF